MNTAELASAYRDWTMKSLAGFPKQRGLDFLAGDPKPPVTLRLFNGERPDPYAHSFEQRLRLLGIDVSTIPRPNTVEVDIGERLGRAPNRMPGVWEMPQAAVLLGIDRFGHIRHDAIRVAAKRFDDLMRAAHSFADDLSRETAIALVTDQLAGAPHAMDDIRRPYAEQYFGTGLFDLGPNEIVLDAGAAVGDSLQKFVAQQPTFDAYYAFEPDAAFSALLTQAVAGTKAQVSTVPLAEKSGTVYLDDKPGTGNTHLADSGRAVQALSIDDFLAGRPITILKMDVEGAEPVLLRGAQKSIERFKPKLLISIYHDVAHLAEIPNLIRSFRPDYRMYLRHHTEADETTSWPGMFFCETVLYAI